MDYARTESGEPPSRTDLAALLSTLHERQHAIGRTFALSLAPGLEALLLRPKAINRAVVNLLDNAWKYGGGASSLEAVHHGNEIHITITDRVPGIPESEQERLKRPSPSEHGPHRRHGPGLGLGHRRSIAACTTAASNFPPNPAAV